MQVKKVFNVSTKALSEKTPYVKPKYKTYRQLLDLDRPKKLVQQESDDENDDFLEKLMKKEQKKQKQLKNKEKQKKSSAKNKKVRLQSGSKQASSSAKTQKQLQTLKPRIPTGESNQNQQNELKRSLQKRNQTEKLSQTQILSQNHNQNDQIHTQKQFKFSQSPQEPKIQQLKIIIKKRKSSDVQLQSNLKLKSDIKSNQQIYKIDNYDHSILRLSQDDANKIIKNNFFSSHKMRKIEGILQLQKATHPKKNFPLQQNAIETKLNPEKKLIEHTISPKKYKKQNQMSYSQRATNFLWKSASSMPVEMILRANKSSTSLRQTKKSTFTSRKSLFKTPYQQQLFLKSLKNK